MWLVRKGDEAFSKKKEGAVIPQVDAVLCIRHLTTGLHAPMVLAGSGPTGGTYPKSWGRALKHTSVSLCSKRHACEDYPKTSLRSIM